MKAQKRVDNPTLTGTGQEMLQTLTEVRFAPYSVLSSDSGSWIPMYELDASVVSEIEALRGLIRAKALRCQVDDCEPSPSGKYVPYLGSGNFQRFCNSSVITSPDFGRLEETMKRIREKYYPEYELYGIKTPRETKNTKFDVTDGVLRNIYRMFSIRKLPDDPVKIESEARKGQFVGRNGAQHGQNETLGDQSYVSFLGPSKMTRAGSLQDGQDGAQNSHLEGQMMPKGGPRVTQIVQKSKHACML